MIFNSYLEWKRSGTVFQTLLTIIELKVQRHRYPIFNDGECEKNAIKYKIFGLIVIEFIEKPVLNLCGN